MKINKNRTEIRVYGPEEDKEISIFLPWGAGLDDWKSAFKSILIHQTFAEEAVKDFFFDECSHSYKEEERPWRASPAEYCKTHYPCGIDKDPDNRSEYEY